MSATLAWIQQFIEEEILQEEVQAGTKPQRPTIELTEKMNAVIDSMSLEEMIGASKIIDLLTDYFSNQQVKKANNTYTSTLDGFRELLKGDIDKRNEEIKSGQRVETDVQKIIANRGSSSKYSSYTGSRNDC